MLKISIKNKIYIYLGAALITIITICFLYLLPTYNSISDKNQLNYDNRIKLEIFKQQRNNLEKTQSDYSSIKGRIDLLSKTFIQNNNIVQLIDELDEFAQANGIQQEINLNNIISNSQNEDIALQITLTGNWQSTYNYLIELEKLDLYINIINLKTYISDGVQFTSFDANFYKTPII